MEEWKGQRDKKEGKKEGKEMHNKWRRKTKSEIHSISSCLPHWAIVVVKYGAPTWNRNTGRSQSFQQL
jgi:hypothetical protein